MADRKVLNKYIPADFDPSKVPKGRIAESNKLPEVRMMLPFTVQCTTCGTFMMKGSKFNSKKQVFANETYLGIKIIHLIMKCVLCNSKFSIRTDPKSADYVVEYGAKRNAEPKKEERLAIESELDAKANQDNEDAIGALERRTEKSRRQMEMLDELEELKAARNRQLELGLTPGALLSIHNESRSGNYVDGGAGVEEKSIEQLIQEEQEEEDTIKSAFASKAVPTVNKIDLFATEVKDSSQRLLDSMTVRKRKFVLGAPIEEANTLVSDSSLQNKSHVSLAEESLASSHPISENQVNKLSSTKKRDRSPELDEKVVKKPSSGFVGLVNYASDSDDST